MDNLVRKALLGDKEARIECAEKGIVLPCPLCGSDGSKIKLNFDSAVAWAECQVCGTTYSITTIGVPNEEEFYLINDWNTRPAPPIGRCGECKHSLSDNEYGKIWCNRMIGNFEVKSDDYCSYFEAREEE